jgi:hypothetical protein
MIFSVVAESGEATGPAALLSDPLDLALGGMGLGEMIVGVLGVLIVAGEYSTGLIRTTFAAVGRRTRVLWAKTAVLAASVFAMAAVAVTAAVVAGQAVYAGDLPTVPLGDALDVIAGSRRLPGRHRADRSGARVHPAVDGGGDRNARRPACSSAPGC